MQSSATTELERNNESPEGEVVTVNTVLDAATAKWVRQVVDYLAATYEVVAGPSGQVVLGRRHEGMVVEWRAANCMSEGVFGDPDVTIPADLIVPICEGLTRRAARHVQLVGLHQYTTPGNTVYASDGFWRLSVATDSWMDQQLCAYGHGGEYWAEHLRLHNRLTQLGAWQHHDVPIRTIVGMLKDGDVAYPIRNAHLMVPCAFGDTKHVIFVAELDVPGEPFLQYGVFGMSVARITDGSPRAGRYQGEKKAVYFPYPTIQEDGTTRWDVLELRPS